MELLIVLCILGLFCGGYTVISKNPVHSVFFLILTFCISASLLLTIVIDFLAIIFIVVYVGAIAVFFLFVVMMLNTKLMSTFETITRYIPLLVVLFFICFFEFRNIIDNTGASVLENVIWIQYLNNADFILILAEVIYTEYFSIFVIAGILLLVAMLGTINITLYHAMNVKRQLVYKQTGRLLSENLVLKT